MPDTEEPSNEDVALQRYLVVTQVCAAMVAGAGKTAAIKEVARRLHMDLRGRVLRIGERTLWRWLAAWQEAGIGGLARATRKLKGSSLPAALLELLVDLKSRWPEISIPEVIRIGRASGVIAENAAIDRSTLWRECRRQGLPTKRRNATRRTGSGRGGFPTVCCAFWPTASTFVPVRSGSNG